MAKSSFGSVIPLALAGGAAWLAWEYWLKPAPAAVRSPDAPGLPNAPAPAAAVTPAAPTAPAFNSLDAIYGRLAAAVGTTPYNVHQFNWFLSKQLPAGKTLPSANEFLPADWVDTTEMTLAQYWAAIAPWLKSNWGLSGLGVFGSLARARVVRG